jgi:hypothetical protein
MSGVVGGWVRASNKLLSTLISSRIYEIVPSQISVTPPKISKIAVVTARLPFTHPAWFILNPE